MSLGLTPAPAIPDRSDPSTFADRADAFVAWMATVAGEIDTLALATNRTLTAGNGLTGGGDLTANRTFTVGAGDGISVGATTVGVDGTVLRTSGAQSAAGAKTFTDQMIIGNYDIAFASTRGLLFQPVGADDNGTIRVKTFATTANTSPIIVGIQGMTTRFNVAANGNVTNQNNSYGAISDETLKHDIAPVSPQLDELRQIEVVTYRLMDTEVVSVQYGEDEDGNSFIVSEETREVEGPKLVGVVAQQVQKIKPGLVEEGQDGLLSVKYSVINVLMLKALQELADKVDALEAQLAS